MISKTFRSQAGPRAPRKISRALRSFLQRHLDDLDLVYELELAVQEACSNIVLYAYGERKNGEIQVQVFLEPDAFLTLKIMDWGKPFHGPKTESPARPDPRSESGRGIYLISQIMDSYEFSHSQLTQTNTLRMEKQLRSRHEMSGH